MKTRFAFAVILLALALAPAVTLRAQQEEKEKNKDAQPPAEMVTYYFVLLTRGPKWTAERTPEVQKIQDAHMANIRKMHEAGKLMLAGPFTDHSNWSGLFVLKADSMDEAKALVATDPAVQAGRLASEIHPWMTQKGMIKDG